MRWCVIFHPLLKQTAIVPETALSIHRGHGWHRISAWFADQTLINPGDWSTDVDLDAEEEVPLEADPSDPEPDLPLTGADLEPLQPAAPDRVGLPVATDPDAVRKTKPATSTAPAVIQKEQP